MSPCPDCGVSLETPLACSACGVLLHVPPETPPHVILGVPVTWSCDTSDMRRNHGRFSRLVHPDYYSTSPVEERERAERNSAILNASLATLSDDLARADWFIGHLKGPSGDQEREMPQEFLIEVMEWNETLEKSAAGGGSPEDLARLDDELTVRRAEVLGGIGTMLTPLPPAGAPALAEVRRLLNAARYIDRAILSLQTATTSRP